MTDLTPAEAAALASADRWFGGGLIAAGVCVALTVVAVARLVREFRTAPLIQPAPRPAVHRIEVRVADTVEVRTDSPVTPEDLMALRVLVARMHPGDREAARFAYGRILDGIAADEAEGLDDALARITGEAS